MILSHYKDAFVHANPCLKNTINRPILWRRGGAHSSVSVICCTLAWAITLRICTTSRGCSSTCPFIHRGGVRSSASVVCTALTWAVTSDALAPHYLTVPTLYSLQGWCAQLSQCGMWYAVALTWAITSDALAPQYLTIPTLLFFYRVVCAAQPVWYAQR